MKYKEVDNIAVIQVEADLNEDTNDILKKSMNDLILEKAGDLKAILLIFKQIKIVDSRALGLIISLHNEANQHQLKFALSDLSDINIEVIKLAQLDQLITIYPSEEEAIKQLSK